MMNNIVNTANKDELSKLLSSVNDPKQMSLLLTDLLTKKEIDEIATRLSAARMLIGGCSYLTVEEKTGLSSRTIARINKWIKNGSGGYKNVLSSHSHIKPVSR